MLDSLPETCVLELAPASDSRPNLSKFQPKLGSPRSALVTSAVESRFSKIKPLQAISEDELDPPERSDRVSNSRGDQRLPFGKREGPEKKLSLCDALVRAPSDRPSFLREGTLSFAPAQSAKPRAGNIPTARLGDLVISPGALKKNQDSHRRPSKQNAEHVDEIILLLQSRGTIASSEMLRPDFRDEADEEDPVLAFWRVSTRSEKVQVRMWLEDHLDYFVSHVWQPPSGFTNVDLYAQQKVQALEMFGRREAMLGGPTGDSPEPWFVLSAAEHSRQKELGNRDPGEAWRRYACWVDKACAHSHSDIAPRSDLENTPSELIRATKSAIAKCRVFTAVLYWHFFSRLWCVMEWARFLADAAPDYRRARLVIHEELLQNRNWDRITESVSSFSLSKLRSGNDQDHPELWLDLEALIVSTQGFERFMQVTAFALLVRYLLLRCTRHCLAFGTDSDCTRKVNTIIESCKKLKLHGLARGLGSARPKHWWMLASRRAKDQIEGAAHDNQCSQTSSSKDSAADVRAKVTRAPAEARPGVAHPGDPHQSVKAVRKESAFDRLENKFDHKLKAASVYHTSAETVHPPRGAANPAAVAAALKAMQALKKREEAQNMFGTRLSGAGVRTKSMVAQKLANLSKNSVSAATPALAGEKSQDPSSPMSAMKRQVHLPDLPDEFQEDSMDHVASMQSVIGGLPDGFSPFWRGATGHLLTDADRIRARVFLQAWRNYREYVNRWFDKYICPHIEVWRHRGIRARGLLEEVFGHILMNVDGALQMSLCNQLAPGLRETTLAAEPPPRGRPPRPCQAPWSNPSLDRMLVVSTGKGHDHPGSLGAGKKDKPKNVSQKRARISFSLDAELQSEKCEAPEPPSILLCPLALECGGRSTHVLLQLTCGDGSEPQTVQLPQRLGVEALNNAFKQLLHGAQQRQHAQITKLELEAVIPRTLLKVTGAKHARMNLGMRLAGTLCAKLVTAGHHPHASTTAASDGGIQAGNLSSTPPPGLIGSDDNESEEDEIDGISIDWTRWLCRSVFEPAETAIAADVTDSQLAEMSRKQTEMSKKQVGVNRKLPLLPITWANQEATRLQSGYPNGLSPGLTPRRDRALASLYVNYSEDPSSPCISPRRPQVATLTPMSKRLLIKARNKLGMAADGSAEDSPGTSSRRTPRRVAGPGGMLPAAAEPCPRRFPQMAELAAQAASPISRMKAVQVPGKCAVGSGQQAFESIEDRAGRTPEEELMEKSEALAQTSANGELIDLMSTWEWTARGHGGPPEAARHVSWTGTMSQIFNKLDEWVATARRSGCPYCVPVSDVIAHFAKGTGGALCPTMQDYVALGDSEQDEVECDRASDGIDALREKAAPPPLARSPPCSRCNHTDVANVSLEQSMLRSIWESHSCFICLHCGLVTPLPPEHVSEQGTLDGDTVLEVTTSIMLKSGTASTFQQKLMRVLRIDHGTVHIAAPASDVGESVSAAKSSVAHLCFTSRAAGIVAAAASSHKGRSTRMSPRRGSSNSTVRYSAIVQETLTGVFGRDLEWAQGSLADTGLDLVYGLSKDVPIDFAIGELDDRRVLPRRKDVCPLVLWAELGHVLSPEFDTNKWIQAAMEVCKVAHFSLPGAIMLRSNAMKLRRANIAATPYKKMREKSPECRQSIAQTSNYESMLAAESNLDEPCHWPVALHRVLVARAGSEDAVLGAALTGSGVKCTSPSELFQSGRTALARMHNHPTQTNRNLAESPSGPPPTIYSIARASVMAKSVKALYSFEQGRSSMRNVIDAGTVMHELVHRRESGDASMGERAVLRARRVLRHIQVVEFLDSWHEKLTEADTDGDWRLSLKEGDANQHEDDDELVEDEDKSDSDSDSDEGGEHVENLVLQKVLGHIKEYVHQADVALKAWTVMNVIVQTCSKFLDSGLVNRSRKSEKSNNVELRVLDHGFVRTALRTLYRHHHRPLICEEVFMMLRHLVKPGHNCAKRTIAELSTPPTNALTFVMSLCHFSEAERINFVSDNLRLLNLMFAKEHTRTPPPLPEGREEEAARALIPILYRHQAEMTIVMSILDLFAGMVRNSKMSCAFFTQGLTEVLRRWLLDSREDKHLVMWVKAKEAAGQIAKSGTTGTTGRLAADFRKRANALKSLTQQVVTCEIMCWDLILTITLASSHCDGFAEDSKKTIVHGIQEMKHQPRSRQWLHALHCLTQMVLRDNDTHAPHLVACGCLECIIAEFPHGEVKEVMPLLIAVLDMSSDISIPKRQPGESDDEYEDVRGSRRDSTSGQRMTRKSHFKFKNLGFEQEDMAISVEDSESDQEEWQDTRRSSQEHGLGGASKNARRLLQYTAAMKRYKPVAADLSGAAGMEKPVMIDRSKGWLIAKEFVPNALTAMSADHGEFSCQVRRKLLRVLAEIFLPRYEAAKNAADKDEVDQLYLQSRAAVTEFEAFGEEYGGGLVALLGAFKNHLDNVELVDTGLFLLHGAFDMFSRIADKAADMDGFWEIVVRAAWMHCKVIKTRRRALVVLRTMREAKPTITGSMCSLWKEEQAGFGLDSESTEYTEQEQPMVGDAKRHSLPAAIESPTRSAKRSGTMPSDGFPRSERPPGDMVRFGAVLRVHWFYLEHGQRPLAEALEPLDQYIQDWEICAVALKGITLGSKMEMENRFRELQKVPNFASIMRRAVEMYADPAAFNPVLQLVVGVLASNPEEKDDLVRTCAIACRVALENLGDKLYNNEESWLNADSWEKFLEAAEAAGRSPGGKEVFAELEVHEILNEVWTQVEASEKQEDRSLVKLHKGQTGFVMELLS